MAVDLNELNLRIQGSANNATDAINTTISALRNLQTAMRGLSNSAAGTRSMTQFFDGLHRGLRSVNVEDVEKLSTLSRRLGGLSTAMRRMSGLNMASFAGLPGALRAITAALDSLNPEQLRRIEQLGAAMKSLSNANVGDTATALGTSSRSVSGAGSGALQSLRLMKDSLTSPIKLFAKLGSVGVSAIRSITSAAKKLHSALSLSNTALGKLISKFASRALSMAIRSIIKAITSAFKDGLEMLYHTQSQARKTLDALATSMSGLKAAAGSALYSAISMVSGALQTLITYATYALNAISQLFAALSGAKTYFQGTTQATQAYTSSAGKASGASNKLATSLLKVDEINKLNDDSSSGGSGSSGSTPSWQQAGIAQVSSISEMLLQAVESGDFSQIGSAIAEKINKALNGINWDTIKAKAEKFANGLATLINGFAQTLDADTLGESLAGAINSGVAAIVKFWHTVDWELLGEKTKSAIRQLFLKVDANAIGQLLVAKFNAAVLYLRGLLKDGINWELVKDKLIECLDGMASGISWQDLQGLIDDIGDAIRDGIHSLTEVVESPRFRAILSQVVYAIGRAFSKVPGILNAMLKLAIALWNAITESIKDYFKGKDMGQVIRDAWEGLKGITDGVEIPTSLIVTFGAISLGFMALNIAKSAFKTLLVSKFGTFLSGVSSTVSLGKGLAIAGGIGFAISAVIQTMDIIEDIKNGVEVDSEKILGAIGSALVSAGLFMSSSGAVLPGMIVVGIGAILEIAPKYAVYSGSHVTKAEGSEALLGEEYAKAFENAKNFKALYEVFEKFKPDAFSGFDYSGLSELVKIFAGGAIDPEDASNFEAVAYAFNQLMLSANGVGTVTSEAAQSFYDLAQASGSFDIDQLKTIAQLLGIEISGLDPSTMERLATASETAADSVDSLATSQSVLTQKGSTAETQMDNVVTVIHEIPTEKQITMKVEGYYETINRLSTIINRLNSINSKTVFISSYETRYQRVAQFASGGFVNSGDLFVANERGAEMVGSIGGKSAVANKAEIGDAIFKYMDKHDRQSGGINTSSLASAIVSACKSAGIGAVYLDGKQLAQSIRNEAHRVGRSVV